MSFLTSVERSIERSLERLFPKRRGERLHPVEIARGMVRAMEGQQAYSVDVTYVPNVFKIRLHPDDLAAVAPVQNTVTRDLMQHCLQIAQKRRYHFAGPLSVSLIADASQAKGTMSVDVAFQEEVKPLPAPSLSTTDDTTAVNRGEDPFEARTQTYRFSFEQTPPSQHVLGVIEGPDKGRVLPLDPTRPLTLGRSPECDLVLSDSRVSKRHALLQFVQGTWWIEDLNSTNGTLINDKRVEKAPLTDGDVVSLGLSTLRFDGEGAFR